MLTRLIKSDSLQVYREPFSYFTAELSLDQELISSSLTWLESEACWKLVETDFYEQHELCWTESQLPASVSPPHKSSLLGRNASGSWEHLQPLVRSQRRLVSS